MARMSAPRAPRRIGPLRSGRHASVLSGPEHLPAVRGFGLFPAGSDAVWSGAASPRRLGALARQRRGADELMPADVGCAYNYPVLKLRAQLLMAPGRGHDEAP